MSRSKLIPCVDFVDQDVFGSQNSSLAFTMYSGGHLSTFLLESDGAVVLNGAVVYNGAWSLTADEQILTVYWNYKQSGRCPPHVYKMIDKETSLYELKTKDGYDIPNPYHLSRALMIRTPRTSRSQGRFGWLKNLIYKLC